MGGEGLTRYGWGRYDQLADVVIANHLHSTQRAINPSEATDHSATDCCCNSKSHACSGQLLLALHDSRPVEEIPELGLDFDLPRQNVALSSEHDIGPETEVGV